ncbi:MAG: ribosome biogenesis GTP-binding protein YihA/YsxC [Nitrospiraceae bacterium]
MAKIFSAQFIRSCRQPEQFPRDRLPEVAFVGRSNVGKSSLINSLLQWKRLAKVSRTPGKTRSINFFRVSTADPLVRHFYVVDFPGYGYAKVAKSVRAQWGPIIERYLRTRSELLGVLLLVDSRGVSPLDKETWEWLRALGLGPVLVATKIDKLTRSERRGSLTMIREIFDVTGDEALIPYSSVTHDGREELWQAIRQMFVTHDA